MADQIKSAMIEHFRWMFLAMKHNPLHNYYFYIILYCVTKGVIKFSGKWASTHMVDYGLNFNRVEVAY